MWRDQRWHDAPSAGTAATAKRPCSPPQEEAALALQAAARGLLARRAVRAVRDAEREAEEVLAPRVADVLMREAAKASGGGGDARAKLAVSEELMRLVLRLDAVRGARAYRRRVVARVLALQDAVVDAVENEAAPGSPRAAEEHGVEAESKPEVETGAEMEVDGRRGIGEPDNAVEQVVGGEMQEPEEEAEGEWDMVTAEPHTEVAAALEAVENSAAPSARGQEPAVQEEEKKVAEAEGVEMKKVMEMVAALCERSAQQCAVIGALAERVDALERAVRRVVESDQRRRRNKKLKKEGKANKKSIRSCYSD